MNLEANKALAVEFLTAFGLGDLDRVFDMMADDAVLTVRTALVPAGNYSKTSLRVLLEKLFNAMDCVRKVDINSLTAKGDQVLMETAWHTQMRGQLFIGQYYVLIEVRDGKIVLFKSDHDKLRFQKAPSRRAESSA